MFVSGANVDDWIGVIGEQVPEFLTKNLMSLLDKR